MHETWRSEPGAVLGETYRLNASLGLIEAGERFEGVDLRDDSPVIITTLHPELFDGTSRGPNTLRVQRSRAYAHARMARVRDIVLAGPSFYVVSEPELGTPLERWVLGRLPLASESVRKVTAQVTEALECIHLIGVHGNLQPANVYVTDSGDVTVSEPWFLEGAEGLQVGAVRPRQGQWSAPEQRTGAWQERHETDVFLLGALVGWLIAGRAVAPGVSLKEQQVEIDERLDAVLLRATAELPEERFHDVGSLWSALEAVWVELESEASGEVVAEEPEILQAVAVPPPLEVVPEVPEFEEDAEQTEAIPLAEIEQMGLDAGIDPDASHVDAIVILDADVDADSVEVLDEADFEEFEAIPLVTDTSFIPVGQLTDDAEVVEAIVEVGIIERDLAVPEVVASEERTVQVVPGPGSARALEAARLADVRRREKLDTPPPVSATPVDVAATPPVRVRSRAVYVAPFLALIAGGAMFWVLSQVLGDQEPRVASPAKVAAHLEVAEPEGKPTDGAAGAAKVAATSTEDTSTGRESEGDSTSHAPTASDAVALAAPVEADTVETADAETAVAAADVGPVKDEKLPEKMAASFEDMEAGDYRCPSGMAKVRSRRKVTLPDGSTKKRKVVWCTDRYEYPGKGSIPSTNVTLGAAKATCRSRGRRLCRRTEWRGACGGSKYPYRGDYDSARCNTVAPGGIPRAVVATGSKPRCRGGFGTYDMTGNVAEWTSDGTVNGGSAYKDGASGTCYRSSRRTGGSPYVGFRCCADPIKNEPQNEGESP